MHLRLCLPLYLNSFYPLYLNSNYLDLLWFYHGLTLFVKTIFHNKLFLEHVIINSWSICLRIMTTLYLKKTINSTHVYIKQDEKITLTLVTFNNIKAYKGNYQLFINENYSWFTPEYFQFIQLSSVWVFFNLHYMNEHNNEQNLEIYFKVAFFFNPLLF